MSNPARILIIEDTESDQYVARRRLLKRWPDAEIMVANDGVEAIALLSSDAARPDLILLDINMPRMGGHAFLQAWFGEHASRIPVVVMLTSSAQEEDRKQSSRYENVRGFIQKPLDVDDVEQLSALVAESVDPADRT